MKFALRVAERRQHQEYKLSWLLGRENDAAWGVVQIEELGAASAVFQPYFFLKQDKYDQQPLISADGRLLFVGSFRLDHRDDLARQLGISKLQADKMSDAALVLGAWEKWSEKTPENIYGDFAFVVHDQREGVTWLAVDRDLGRGLYYTQGEFGLLVTSSLPIMRNYPYVSNKLDNDFIADHLCDLSSDLEGTPYKDIKRVPWSSILRFDQDGQKQSWRYWDYNPDKQIRFKKDDDYVDAARELLDDAVRSYLRTDGPFSGCLTGGLDAAAVIGTLQKLDSGREIHAITAVPSLDTPKSVGIQFDEGARASQTAANWPDVQHHLLAIKNAQHKGLISSPEATFLAGGIPVRNINNIDWLGNIYQHARQMGSSGLFDGVRGNVGLSWNGFDTMASAWASWRFDKAVQSAWLLAKNDPDELGFLRTLWRQAVKPNVSRPIRDICSVVMGFPLWTQIGRTFFIKPEVVQDRKLVSRVLEQAEDGYRKSRKQSAACKIAYMHDVNNRLLQRNMHQVNCFGVVPLSPLGNTRLLEFCFAIPDEQYFSRGQGRWLAKRVLADRLPPENLTPQPRIRQGGNHYARMSYHKDFLYDEVERLAKSPAVSSVLDIHKMKSVLDNWPKDDVDWHRQKGMDILLGIHLPRAINMGQFIRWVDGGNE